MAIRSSDYLKGIFEDGDRPTGANFADLIESTLNSSVSSLSGGGGERLAIISEGLSAVGNLYTTGNLQVDGTTTLGSANNDNVVFNADVNSNVLPNTDATYNLGSTAKRWDKLCVLSLSGNNVTATGTVSAALGFKAGGGTGVTTTVAVSTNAGPQTLTFTHGLLTSVA